MPPMSQKDAVARWGSTMHLISDTEQKARHTYDALKQLYPYAEGSARPAVQIATYDVKEAHAKLCEAIRVLNTVAVKPDEGEPHKPIDRL